MDEYPNSSETFEDQQWHPEPPEEQKEIEAKEKNKVSSSLPVIEEILAWYEARASYFNSSEALEIDEKTPPELAKEIALTCKHFSSVYSSEAAKFRADFAKYLKEEDNK